MYSVPLDRGDRMGQRSMHRFVVVIARRSTT